ncbi:MAG TPA: glycosyltransferase family 39 protein [Phototrophicaceae bacterium]|nr:glycosyltransferase family 39 protein [Phototrophicaceae bacterium]
MSRVLLVLLIVIYFIVGVLYVVRTPAWQAPDEPAHYNYVAQVVNNGCCPVLEVGDWNSAYLDSLKAARFAPDLLGELATVQYENHQPPLYYLIEAVIFRLSSGSLIALRLFSLILGAGVVASAYLVGAELLPDQPQIALGAAALVAFVPQHLAMLAAVDNDSLAELIVGLTLWLTIRYLKTDRVKAWQLGVLVGIGLLTKVDTIFLCGLVPLAIVIKWWIGRRLGAAEGEDEEFTLLHEYGTSGDQHLWSGFPLLKLITFALPALILGGIWWLRDFSVYGFPDIFGLGRHNLVVADQPRTAAAIQQMGLGEYLRSGVITTFDSFWGQFGWMAFPLQPWMYTLILIFLVIAALGLIVSLRRPLAPEPNRELQRAAWFIVGLTGLLAIAQFIYYNLEFLQLQGRYMFPGLIPLGLVIALGFDGWRRLIIGDNGRSTLRPYIGVAVIGLLIPFNLYLVWYVIPGLAP